jgi:hypothetical protein
MILPSIFFSLHCFFPTVLRTTSIFFDRLVHVARIANPAWACLISAVIWASFSDGTYSFIPAAR